MYDWCLVLLLWKGDLRIERQRHQTKLSAFGTEWSDYGPFGTRFNDNIKPTKAHKTIRHLMMAQSFAFSFASCTYCYLLGSHPLTYPQRPRMHWSIGPLVHCLISSVVRSGAARTCGSGIQSRSRTLHPAVQARLRTSGALTAVDFYGPGVFSLKSGNQMLFVSFPFRNNSHMCSILCFVNSHQAYWYARNLFHCSQANCDLDSSFTI